MGQLDLENVILREDTFQFVLRELEAVSERLNADAPHHQSPATLTDLNSHVKSLPTAESNSQILDCSLPKLPDSNGVSGKERGEQKMSHKNSQMQCPKMMDDSALCSCLLSLSSLEFIERELKAVNTLLETEKSKKCRFSDCLVKPCNYDEPTILKPNCKVSIEPNVWQQKPVAKLDGKNNPVSNSYDVDKEDQLIFSNSERVHANDKALVVPISGNSDVACPFKERASTASLFSSCPKDPSQAKRGENNKSSYNAKHLLSPEARFDETKLNRLQKSTKGPLNHRIKTKELYPLSSVGDINVVRSEFLDISSGHFSEVLSNGSHRWCKEVFSDKHQNSHSLSRHSIPCKQKKPQLKDLGNYTSKRPSFRLKHESKCRNYRSRQSQQHEVVDDKTKHWRRRKSKKRTHRPCTPSSSAGCKAGDVNGRSVPPVVKSTATPLSGKGDSIESPTIDSENNFVSHKGIASNSIEGDMKKNHSHSSASHERQSHNKHLPRLESAVHNLNLHPHHKLLPPFPFIPLPPGCVADTLISQTFNVSTCQAAHQNTSTYKSSGSSGQDIAASDDCCSCSSFPLISAVDIFIPSSNSSCTLSSSAINLKHTSVPFLEMNLVPPLNRTRDDGCSTGLARQCPPATISYFRTKHQKSIKISTSSYSFPKTIQSNFSSDSFLVSLSKGNSINAVPTRNSSPFVTLSATPHDKCSLSFSSSCSILTSSPAVRFSPHCIYSPSALPLSSSNSFTSSSSRIESEASVVWSSIRRPLPSIGFSHSKPTASVAGTRPHQVVAPLLGSHCTTSTYPCDEMKVFPQEGNQTQPNCSPPLFPPLPINSPPPVPPLPDFPCPISFLECKSFSEKSCPRSIASESAVDVSCKQTPCDQSRCLDCNLKDGLISNEDDSGEVDIYHPFLKVDKGVESEKSISIDSLYHQLTLKSILPWRSDIAHKSKPANEAFTQDKIQKKYKFSFAVEEELSEDKREIVVSILFSAVFVHLSANYVHGICKPPNKFLCWVLHLEPQ